MLRYLRARNFALIDNLELQFERGFNLLSGETGAGKSIVVDALALLGGAKASTETIRSGESRGTVEAVFEADLAADLEKLGLESENGEVIIKREISVDGRNRVFINNQPTTVSALKQLAPALLDIHGQHEQQTLLDAANQLDLVDVFAEAVGTAARVAQLHADIRRTAVRIEELAAEHGRKLERLDLLTFQLDEIQKANPRPGETEQAKERLAIVSNATKLVDATTRAYEILYESEASVTTALAQVQRILRDAAQHDKRLEPLVGQVQSAVILVQDLAYGLRDYPGNIDIDPKELEQLQLRLAELERLHRKYGPDLPGHMAKLNEEVDSIGLTETQKEELQQNLEKLTEEYRKAAAALSRQRRSASRKLEKLVAAELKGLAMPNARFEVSWEDVSPGGADGIDKVEFRISANPGEEPRPLDRIASGGELSRIMLALRTVLTDDAPGKTLIFDEVDAGIGGKAAETVGLRLHALSGRYQILCVTHLAQIAACADHQYRIEKQVLGGRTVTRVEPLTGENRIDELARMMTGSHITDSARQHIREMLEARK